MKVIIVRGLPGSGKSTYIKNNFPEAIVCSADHFFMDKKGTYNFDPAKIGDAHKECQRKFYSAILRLCAPFVIVDNTNLSLWEMSYYVSLANIFNIPVEIHKLEVPVEVCAERNIHGVTIEKIIAMQARMEKVPPFFAKEIRVIK